MIGRTIQHDPTLEKLGVGAMCVTWKAGSVAN